MEVFTKRSISPNRISAAIFPLASYRIKDNIIGDIRLTKRNDCSHLSEPAIASGILKERPEQNGVVSNSFALQRNITLESSDSVLNRMVSIRPTHGETGIFKVHLSIAEKVFDNQIIQCQKIRHSELNLILDDIARNRFSSSHTISAFIVDCGSILTCASTTDFGTGHIGIQPIVIMSRRIVRIIVNHIPAVMGRG